MTDTARVAAIIAEFAKAMQAMDATAHAAVAAMADAVIDCFKQGRQVLVCGNGGSAADAQHISAELAGRFLLERRPLPCISLTTNTSILTAIGNDFSFDEVYSRQVAGLGRKGDVLWGISTSGNSRNVLEAARLARQMGLRVIGMTGPTGGKLLELCDVCFRAPAQRTDRIQQLHQVAYHLICELVDEAFAARKP